MKNTKKLLLILPAILFLSCLEKETKTIDHNQSLTNDTLKKESDKPIGDNSQVSLDWSGTYEATLPCADCPGIKSVLILNDDQTFKLSEEYLERNVKNEDEGTFSWDQDGQKIALKGKTTKTKFFVGENQLFHLDTEGNIIEGAMKDFFIYRKK